MFIRAKLVFEHYIPEQTTKGMMFKQRIKDVIYGKVYEYDRVFEMNSLPSLTPEDFDSFIQMHGYPVKPVIMSITANPDDKADVLANNEQIGWWDDGPGVDELRDIELKDINAVLSDYDGELDIEVVDEAIEDGLAIPIIYMDKVTIRLPWDEDDYLYEQDDYPEEYDDEEDWDDMDDNPDDEPDTDSAGFTSHNRYNPNDHDTE